MIFLLTHNKFQKKVPKLVHFYCWHFIFIECVCMWSLLFCRISLFIINSLEPFILFYLFFYFFKCICKISAASPVSMRIQIAIGPAYKRSVSLLEYKSQEVWTTAKGALQWRMAIEMKQKNASKIKKRMSTAVQSTPALQSQLIPAPLSKLVRDNFS